MLLYYFEKDRGYSILHLHLLKDVPVPVLLPDIEQVSIHFTRKQSGSKLDFGDNKAKGSVRLDFFPASSFS